MIRVVARDEVGHEVTPLNVLGHVLSTSDDACKQANGARAVHVVSGGDTTWNKKESRSCGEKVTSVILG